MSYAFRLPCFDANADTFPFQHHAPPLEVRGTLHKYLNAPLDEGVTSSMVKELEKRGIYLSGDVANQGRSGTYASATGAKAAARLAETLQFESLGVTRPGEDEDTNGGD